VAERFKAPVLKFASRRPAACRPIPKSEDLCGLPAQRFEISYRLIRTRSGEIGSKIGSKPLPIYPVRPAPTERCRSGRTGRSRNALGCVPANPVQSQSVSFPAGFGAATGAPYTTWSAPVLWRPVPIPVPIPNRETGLAPAGSHTPRLPDLVQIRPIAMANEREDLPATVVPQKCPPCDGRIRSRTYQR
jgi:hypothetical protein